MADHVVQQEFYGNEHQRRREKKRGRESFLDELALI
jgi:hypothetical protein